jgi:glycosyltransferase involved in cell wall biosynthesis
VTGFTAETSPEHIDIETASIRHYSLAEQYRLPAIFSDAELDLLHVPHFNVPLWTAWIQDIPLVVTIHDLLWHEQRGAAVTTLPSWQYWAKYLGYRAVTRSAVSRAERIIVPSRTVGKTVAAHYAGVEDKTTVIYEGVDPSWFEQGDTLEDLTPDKIHLVYVGSLYPHKNVSLVLRALAADETLQLHLVGARSVFLEETRAEVQRLGVQEQVREHGYLEDADLRSLLQAADALVQPSLSEGFGLTGIEAMATGTPVLASDIEVFREVYADRAIYFQPQHVESLREALLQLRQLDPEAYAKQALSYAEQFSWERMSQETVEIYQDVLNNV